MCPTFETRLRECLAQTPLLSRLPTLAGPLLERRAKDAASEALDGANLEGLARVIASNADAARFLSHRPSLLERIATASPQVLQTRGRELETLPAAHQGDLERFLEWLRLTRRDETTLAACLDLSGSLPFEAISVFLSQLAEACTRWALEEAQAQISAERGPVLSVLGMGKVAGREFTYHSDLDLIFLYPDDVTEPVQASRTAQRLIQYLTTMTGAGVAYAVDSRLRPSGRQGALVSTHQAFERYQSERAATWEHLALMRARAIAGDIPQAQEVLRRARAAVLQEATRPWPAIAEMRARVEQERGRGSSDCVPLKTGAGGLMDVEFLAAGGLLERGLWPASDEPPSVAWMLHGTARGPKLERLMEGYHFLRRVEARNRWMTGRGDESLQLNTENIDVLAELVEPGLSPAQLTTRIEDVRSTIRTGYAAVVAAGTIDALCS